MNISVVHFFYVPKNVPTVYLMQFKSPLWTYIDCIAQKLIRVNNYEIILKIFPVIPVYNFPNNLLGRLFWFFYVWK